MLRKMVVCVLVAGNLAICIGFVMAGSYQLDLDVYRIGARTWLNGGELYGELPATGIGLLLPFTYPPVAAVLLAPATLVSLPVAGGVLTVLTIGLLLVVIAQVLGALAPAWPRWSLAAAVLPVAVYLEPVRETLSYGQVNVLLMAMVTADCLAVKSRLPRGVLIGVAAAIKLTPAAFVLFFLLRKDYRAVARAGAAFAVTTAAGFVFAWSDSVRYWTSTLYDTKRIGMPHFAGNQSLPAVLARFGMDSPVRTAVWLLGAAVVLGLTVIAMRRAFDAGLPALALGVNALAVLICSPVSWSHHWVWLVPVLVVFGYLWRAPIAAVIAGAGVLLFMVGPQWSFPETLNREFTWNFGQQLVGNSYLYFAVLVLIVVAAGSGVTRLARPRPQGSPSRIAISDEQHGRPVLLLREPR